MVVVNPDRASIRIAALVPRDDGERPVEALRGPVGVEMRQDVAGPLAGEGADVAVGVRVADPQVGDRMVGPEQGRELVGEARVPVREHGGGAVRRNPAA